VHYSFTLASSNQIPVKVSWKFGKGMLHAVVLSKLHESWEEKAMLQEFRQLAT